MSTSSKRFGPIEHSTRATAVTGPTCSIDTTRSRAGLVAGGGRRPGVDDREVLVHRAVDELTAGRRGVDRRGWKTRRNRSVSLWCSPSKYSCSVARSRRSRRDAPTRCRRATRAGRRVRRRGRPRCSAVRRSANGGARSGTFVGVRLRHRAEEPRQPVEVVGRPVTGVVAGQQAEADPDHPVLHGEQGELLQRGQLVAVHPGRVGEPGGQLVAASAARPTVATSRRGRP